MALADLVRRRVDFDDSVLRPVEVLHVDGVAQIHREECHHHGDREPWPVSENERRRNDAWDASIEGKAATGVVTHQLHAGVQGMRYKARFQQQAYNYVGQGNIDGSVVTGSDPALVYDNTNRDERRTEFYASDAMQFGAGLGLWLGVRHTRLERESITTSGTERTDYEDSFTTPWLAASWQANEALMLYASWGQGIESEVELLCDGADFVCLGIPGCSKSGKVVQPQHRLRMLFEGEPRVSQRVLAAVGEQDAPIAKSTQAPPRNTSRPRHHSASERFTTASRR